MKAKKTDTKTGGAMPAAETAADRSGGFPTWVDMLVMIVIFFAATLVAAGVMTGLRGAWPDMEKELLTAVTYFTQFLAAILGIWFYRRGRGAKKSVFHFSLKWYNASLVVLGLLLMLASSVVMEPILALFPDKHFEALNNAIGSGGWAILTTVLLAPVFEEMLFRGLILESIKQKWGANTAVVLSALLFGLVHLPIFPQMLNAFVMGIMMGYVYVLTDSLLSVIIIHSANNALAFLFLEITGNQQTDMRAMLGNDTIYWIVYAASLVVFIGAVVAMALLATRKRQQRSEIKAVFASADGQNDAPDGEKDNNND